MTARRRPLPALAFGERRVRAGHDVEALRGQLAILADGVADLSARGQQTFRAKSCVVQTHGMGIAAFAGTPLGLRIAGAREQLLLMCLAGGISVAAGGAVHCCGAGAIAVIAGGEPSLEFEHGSYLAVSFAPARMLQSIAELLGEGGPDPAAVIPRRTRVLPPSPLQDGLLAACRLIDISVGEQRALDLLRIDDLIYRLLALLMLPGLAPAGAAGEVPARRDRRLCVMEAFAREHLGERLSVGDLAQQGGVSPRLMQQMFLKVHGVSASQWVRNTRLDVARTLLLNPGNNQRIREIAFALGFTKSGLFSAQYRQRFGETPAETRASLVPMARVEDEPA